jgi:hypothetical protein
MTEIRRDTCHIESVRKSVASSIGPRSGRQRHGIATADAQCRHRPTGEWTAELGPYAPGKKVNWVVLSGLIVETPQRDKSREGEPVTVLLVSLAAPDESVHRGWACCEVEIPDAVAEPHRNALRAGRPILIAGELTGAGDIWAQTIVTGEGS